MSDKSKVWIYFKKCPDINYVRCGVCQKQFKFCNNTTNMKEHLRRKHPEKMVTFLDPNNTDTSGTRTGIRELNEDTVNVYSCNSTRKKHLDKLFAEMIAIDMEPLRMFDHEGLKAFVYALDPKYEMPSRTRLTCKLLPDLHNQLKGRLSELLENCAVPTSCPSSGIWVGLAMKAI